MGRSNTSFDLLTLAFWKTPPVPAVPSLMSQFQAVSKTENPLLGVKFRVRASLQQKAAYLAAINSHETTQNFFLQQRKKN